MPRPRQDLTVEIVEQMTTEDIAKLPKKMRRKVNEMLEKINIKKEADAKAENLRLANIEKERKRIKGVEKKRLEKENQMKKDDERHRLMSKDVAKMTEAVASVSVVEKKTNKQEKRLPFHKSIVKFLAANPLFRSLLPDKNKDMFDKLITMSKLELTEILLRNGFSLKPPHAIDFVIKEVCAGGIQSKLYREFRLPVGDENDGILEWLLYKGSPQDLVLVTLATMMEEGDMKYANPFIPSDIAGFCGHLIKDSEAMLLGMMDNLKTFLFVNDIPWRETRLEDMVKAIEHPIGRLVRLGRYYAREGWPNICHPRRCECPAHFNQGIKLAVVEIQARLYIDKYGYSHTWRPLIPKNDRDEHAKVSEYLFERCSEGIICVCCHRQRQGLENSEKYIAKP